VLGPFLGFPKKRGEVLADHLEKHGALWISRRVASDRRARERDAGKSLEVVNVLAGEPLSSMPVGRLAAVSKILVFEASAPGCAQFLDRAPGPDTLAFMSDLKIAQLQFIESLMAFDRASQDAEQVQPVLPADLDLDDELGQIFNELAR
jgi:hypothetical protein